MSHVACVTTECLPDFQYLTHKDLVQYFSEKIVHISSMSTAEFTTNYGWVTTSRWPGVATHLRRLACDTFSSWRISPYNFSRHLQEPVRCIRASSPFSRHHTSCCTPPTRPSHSSRRQLEWEVKKKAIQKRSFWQYIVSAPDLEYSESAHPGTCTCSPLPPSLTALILNATIFEVTDATDVSCVLLCSMCNDQHGEQVRLRPHP